MDSADAKALVDEISADAVARRQADKLSKAEAYRMSINEYTAAQKHAAFKQAQAAKINEIKYVEATQFIDKFPNNPVKGLYAFVDGVESNIKNSRYSLNAKIASRTKQLFQDFHTRLQESGVYEAWSDKTYGKKISQEIYSPNSTGDIKARKAAQALTDTFNGNSQLMNSLGADISTLPEFLGTQHHSVDNMLKPTDGRFSDMKMRMALRKQGLTGTGLIKAIEEQAYQRWAKTIAPELDWAKIKHNGNQEDFLKNVYKGLTTGNHGENKSFSDPSVMPFKGPRNLAKKISQSRVLHFKDGESWFKYNEIYGNGTLQNTVYRTLEKQAKNLAVLETLGTNPDAMFEKLVSYATKDMNIKAKNSNVLENSKNVYKAIMNPGSMVLDNWGARLFSTLRLSYAFRMAFLPFYSISDATQFHMMYKNNGVKFIDNLFGGATNMFAGLKRKDKMEVAKAVMIWSDLEKSGPLSAFMANDLRPGVMSSLTSWFYKFNVMDRVTANQHFNAAAVLSQHIYSYKNKAFEKLPKELAETFGLYGIEKAEWELIRSAENKKIGKYNLLAPDNMASLKNSDIAKYLGVEESALTDAMANEVRKDMADRLAVYYPDQAGHAIILPGIADKALVVGNTKAGTIAGEVTRSVSHLLGYFIAFQRRMLGKVFLGRGGETVSDAVMQGKSDFAGMMMLLVGGTVYGTIMDAMADVAGGKAPKDFSDPKTWVNGFLRSGMAGKMMDYLVNDYRQRSAGEVFSGPLINGPIKDGAELFSDIVNLRDPTKSAYHLAKNNFNILNLWYTQAIMNYMLFYQINEFLDPGSNLRMERSLYNRTGQEYFFPPHEHVD